LPERRGLAENTSQSIGQNRRKFTAHKSSQVKMNVKAGKDLREQINKVLHFTDEEVNAWGGSVKC
jgi:transcriptional regulator